MDGEHCSLERCRRRCPDSVSTHTTEIFQEEQDSGSVYTVTVQIGNRRFTVDLRDNPNQDRGPNNTNNVSRDGATLAAQMALLNVTELGGSANAGHLRPLHVITRAGSVFDPSPVAACSPYYDVRIPAL